MSTVTRPTDLPLHTPEDETLSRFVVVTADYSVAMVETRNSIYSVVNTPTRRIVTCPDGVMLIADCIRFDDDMMWVYDANGRLLLRTSTVQTTHVIEN